MNLAAQGLHGGGGFGARAFRGNELQLEIETRFLKYNCVSFPFPWYQVPRYQVPRPHFFDQLSPSKSVNA